jgi:hypothetical protein
MRDFSLAYAGRKVRLKRRIHCTECIIIYGSYRETQYIEQLVVGLTLKRLLPQRLCASARKKHLFFGCETLVLPMLGERQGLNDALFILSVLLSPMANCKNQYIEQLWTEYTLQRLHLSASARINIYLVIK